MQQIYNCPQLFENRCPQRWENLVPTDEERRRHCSICDNSVYESRTPDEFVRLGSNGKCVAIPDHVFDRLRGHEAGGLFQMMGLPSKAGLQKMQDDLNLRMAWMKALKQFHGEAE